MGLAAIRDIDEVLHSSLKQVEIFALKKGTLLKQDGLSEEERDEAIKQVRLNQNL